MPEPAELYASTGTPLPPHRTIVIDPHVMNAIEAIGFAIVVVLVVIAHLSAPPKRGKW